MSDKPHLELSAQQVLGGALAATAAAVAGSTLGVTGTVVGASVMSTVSTVAAALYTHSYRRGRDVVERRRLRHGDTPDRVDEVERIGAPAPDRPCRGDRGTGVSLWLLALSGVCVLVLALGIVTGVEGLLGQPVSAAIGHSSTENGTTVGRIVSGGGTHGAKGTGGDRRSPTPSTSGSDRGTPHETSPTPGPSAPTSQPTQQPSQPTQPTQEPTQEPTQPTEPAPTGSTVPPASSFPPDTTPPSVQP